MITIPKNIEAIVSCDLETTGLDVNLGACWITGSFGKLDPVTLQTIDELELKSRPYHWDEEARRIHRISIHTAREFPEREESLQKLIDWLPKDRNFAFLCHAKSSYFDSKAKRQINAHFDFAMLKSDFLYQDRYFDFYKYFDEKKIISTITIAKSLGIKDVKLNDLCEYFKIELNHHDARSDRIACEEIFRRFYNESNSLSFGDRGSKLNTSIPVIQKDISLEKQQRFGI